ncbi:hypothetical protein ACFFYR_19525 [Paraburkholderia dipogonis]|nr:hypothetical protein [Paraburkholderia dipogonis]
MAAAIATSFPDGTRFTPPRGDTRIDAVQRRSKCLKKHVTLIIIDASSAGTAARHKASQKTGKHSEWHLPIISNPVMC